MELQYYFKRIINSKIKFGVILLIFLLPIIDIIFMLKDIHMGGSVIAPDLASFLSSTLFNGAQIFFLWYLPIYFLILTSDDCIEDYHTGYKNILVSKFGKKKYFAINILKGFIFAFAAVFLSFILNLIMTNIIFSGGTYYLENENILELLQNGLIINIAYILFVSFLSGIVSMGAVAVSMFLHNRYIVYPIVFILWYIPSSGTKSIILAMQPFTEYSIIELLPTVLLVIGINIAAVISSYVKVIKYDKI